MEENWGGLEKKKHNKEGVPKLFCLMRGGGGGLEVCNTSNLDDLSLGICSYCHKMN